MIKTAVFNSQIGFIACFDDETFVESVHGTTKRNFKHVKSEMRRDGYKPQPISREKCLNRFGHLFCSEPAHQPENFAI